MKRAVLQLVIFGAMGGATAHAQMSASKCTMWQVQTTPATNDSVLITSNLFRTPDGSSWVMKLPNQAPVPVRVVSSGGDSMVAEAGPYPSALRPGRTVTLLRLVTHVYERDMTGTIEAHYDSGNVFQGRIKARCPGKK